MCLFFFFNDTATTEIYTLSLHDALPIFQLPDLGLAAFDHLFPLRIRWSERITPCSSKTIPFSRIRNQHKNLDKHGVIRSEEHTSELQSPDHLVCRLLLEKKKKDNRSLTSGSSWETPLNTIRVSIRVFI